jgi:hypothetical protein
VQFGITNVELDWFSSYLTNREQVCIVNGITSTPKKIVCGVPQGSIVGPLLFLLYINDLPDCLDKTTPRLYADDTQIFSAAKDLEKLSENINHDMNKLREWLIRNKLQHHPTKTKVMYIGSITIFFTIYSKTDLAAKRLNCKGYILQKKGLSSLYYLLLIKILNKIKIIVTLS